MLPCPLFSSTVVFVATHGHIVETHITRQNQSFVESWQIYINFLFSKDIQCINSNIVICLKIYSPKERLSQKGKVLAILDNCKKWKTLNSMPKLFRCNYKIRKIVVDLHSFHITCNLGWQMPTYFKCFLMGRCWCHFSNK